MALARPLGKAVSLNHCCKVAPAAVSITPDNRRETVTRTHQLHLSPASELYQHTSSQFPSLMPPNIDELNSASRVRFSPRRSRDVSGRLALIASHGSWVGGALLDQQSSVAPSTDVHVQSFDCRGTVSLNATMQTNVPEPFNVQLSGHSAAELQMPGGLPTHLNMPGGQLSQEDKYISRDQQEVHHSRLTQRRKA